MVEKEKETDENIDADETSKDDELVMEIDSLELAEEIDPPEEDG